MKGILLEVKIDYLVNFFICFLIYLQCCYSFFNIPQNHVQMWVESLFQLKYIKLFISGVTVLLYYTCVMAYDSYYNWLLWNTEPIIITSWRYL